ncbi:MAG: cupredoxin domain-containing protein [Candidatus Aenigmatarchaeota archaeon]
MEQKHVITIIGLVVMISIFIFAAKAMFVNTGNVVDVDQTPIINNQVQGEQIVQLSFKNGNYYPNTIELKKGVPVVIEVDMNTVRGCYRSIIIPTFGVRKTVTTSNNKIEFTPDKAGTFGFSCSMGMGTGKLVVEDESGNVPASVNTVSQDIPTGGSCSTGGGGCGCGG